MEEESGIQIHSGLRLIRGHERAIVYQKSVDWQFTAQDARLKLKREYPQKNKMF
jgi:hypothetical protein